MAVCPGCQRALGLGDPSHEGSAETTSVDAAAVSTARAPRSLLLVLLGLGLALLSLLGVLSLLV